ncbi:M50 family metallopeptidase [Clostridiaceae bacterium 35-E11]
MKLMNIWGVDIKFNIWVGIVFIIFFIFGYVENVVISFFIVLFHEGAHMMMAKTLGYRIESIELFPFGGVARIEESIAVNPQHEVMIAIIGPLINFIAVLISYNLLNILHISNELFVFFIYANLTIGIFNLLPIIPLDGGRVFRAYLAYLIGFKRATKIAVIIAKAISFFLFLWGCYVIQYHKLNFLVLFIAIFLYIAAHKEHKMAVFIFMKEITQKNQHLLSEGVLKTKYLVAVKNTSAKDVINQFIPRTYHIITVMDKGCKVIGVLTESELVDGVMEYGLNVSLEKLLIDQ